MHTNDHSSRSGEQQPPAARRAVYVDETMATHGGYLPALVTEHVSGFVPLAGNGPCSQPWVWGPTIDDAKRIAREANTKLGLADDDVAAIVASSMSSTVRPGRAASQTVSVDEAMALIVQAPTAEAALQLCQDLPLRTLRALADLMHLDEGGHRSTLTRRVVTEARG